jgi:ribose-phosphate pyrophosphokinase
MKRIVLNLVDQQNGDIDYELMSFPDGQHSIELHKFHKSAIENNKNNNKPQEIVIYSRLNSFIDLEIIICANWALKNAGADNVSLYVPYLLGARSDRSFSYNGLHYLKNVIAPIINLQGFSEVKVMDAHSDVCEALINNFKNIGSESLVRFAMNEIAQMDVDPDMFLFVSPDAGALKKVNRLAMNFGVQNVCVANKVRDVRTGRITSTNIDLNITDQTEYIVLIDDICDGGRTFIELAKQIKEQTKHRLTPMPLYLVVTHGVFSDGAIYKLENHFDVVFTTDSVSDFVYPNFLAVKELFK